MIERSQRDVGKQVAGAGRRIFAAGALALTEPGPAAAGIVITDEQGRLLAQRANYIGHSTQVEATAQALLAALRLAIASGLAAPVIRVDDRTLAEALMRGAPLAGRAAPLGQALREALIQLPGNRVEVISSAANLARPVALTPLVEWLPERTRRSEALDVRALGNCVYEVSSESRPGESYRVTLRPPGVDGDGDPASCECADFMHRGIPCKHLLAAAREAGALERIFYPDHAGQRSE